MWSVVVLAPKRLQPFWGIYLLVGLLVQNPHGRFSLPNGGVIQLANPSATGRTPSESMALKHVASGFRGFHLENEHGAVFFYVFGILIPRTLHADRLAFLIDRKSTRLNSSH